MVYSNYMKERVLLSNQNRQVLVSDHESTNVGRPPRYEARDIVFPEEI